MACLGSCGAKIILRSQSLASSLAMSSLAEDIGMSVCCCWGCFERHSKTRRDIGSVNELAAARSLDTCFAVTGPSSNMADMVNRRMIWENPLRDHVAFEVSVSFQPHRLVQQLKNHETTPPHYFHECLLSTRESCHILCPIANIRDGVSTCIYTRTHACKYWPTCPKARCSYLLPIHLRPHTVSQWL